MSDHDEIVLLLLLVLSYVSAGFVSAAWFFFAVVHFVHSVRKAPR